MPRGWNHDPQLLDLLLDLCQQLWWLHLPRRFFCSLSWRTGRSLIWVLPVWRPVFGEWVLPDCVSIFDCYWKYVRCIWNWLSLLLLSQVLLQCQHVFWWLLSSVLRRTVNWRRLQQLELGLRGGKHERELSCRHGWIHHWVFKLSALQKATWNKELAGTHDFLQL